MRNIMNVQDWLGDDYIIACSVLQARYGVRLEKKKTKKEKKRKQNEKTNKQKRNVAGKRHPT